MKRIFIATALLLICLFFVVTRLPAPPATMTTVADTLYTANDTLFNGTMDISWSTFTDINGFPHPRGHFQLQIRNGVLSVQLQPTDTAIPSGQFYTVTYALTQGLPVTEYWLVPTSLTPVKLSVVRTAPPPAPSFVIPYGQLALPSTCVPFGATTGLATCDVPNLSWSDGGQVLGFSAGVIQNLPTPFFDFYVAARSGYDVLIGNVDMGTAIQVPKNTINVLIPALAGTGTRCVHATSTGLLGPAAADCGSGGGGVTVSAGAGINVVTVGSVSTVSTDPAVIPTKAVVQAGTSNIITLTSSGTATLVGTQNPTAGAYSTSQPYYYISNFSSSGAATLNVDSAGVKNVYANDGTSNPTFVSGTLYALSYNPNLNSSAGGFQCTNCITGGGSSSYVLHDSWSPLQTGGNVGGNQYWVASGSISAGGCGADGCIINFASMGTDSWDVWSAMPSGWTSGAVTMQLTFEGSGAGNTVQFGVSVGCLVAGSTSYNTRQNFSSQVTSGSTKYFLTSPSLTLTGCAAKSPINFLITRVDSNAGSAYPFRADAYYTVP